KEIEGFTAELQLTALSDPEILEHGETQRLRGWTRHGLEAQVAASQRRGQFVRADVEPLARGAPTSGRLVGDISGNDIRHAPAPDTLASAGQGVGNASAKVQITIRVPVTQNEVGGAIHVAAH